MGRFEVITVFASRKTQPATVSISVPELLVSPPWIMPWPRIMSSRRRSTMHSAMLCSENKAANFRMDKRTGRSPQEVRDCLSWLICANFGDVPLARHLLDDDIALQWLQQCQHTSAASGK